MLGLHSFTLKIVRTQNSKMCPILGGFAYNFGLQGHELSCSASKIWYIFLKKTNKMADS